MKGVDPEVVDAITQTMVGEWLFKYTRHKLLGGSDRRHPRYFFVHPFNRMLHWMEADPRTVSGAEGRSKNAMIEQVGVVEDHNSHPPGLHYQTIVIRTASRELRITASSKARHRVWYLALSYLANGRVPGSNFGTSNMSIPLELGGIDRNATDEFGTINSTRTLATPRGTLRRLDALFAPVPGHTPRHRESGRLRHSLIAGDTARESLRTPRMSALPMLTPPPVPPVPAIPDLPRQVRSPPTAVPAAQPPLSTPSHDSIARTTQTTPRSVAVSRSTRRARPSSAAAPPPFRPLDIDTGERLDSGIFEEPRLPESRAPRSMRNTSGAAAPALNTGPVYASITTPPRPRVLSNDSPSLIVAKTSQVRAERNK